MAGNVTRSLAHIRGRRAENQALNFLRRRGLELLERNFSCRYGEIDLVMLQANTLIFVEVRSRKPGRFGAGLESVDRHKQARLMRAASRYVSAHPAFADHCMRFDVVALDRIQGTTVKLQWLRDAFRP